MIIIIMMMMIPTTTAKRAGSAALVVEHLLSKCTEFKLQRHQTKPNSMHFEGRTFLSAGAHTSRACTC
jgi:hypothetical protein